jgi:thiol-disulfide isomerase/thioredoxin
MIDKKQPQPSCVIMRFRFFILASLFVCQTFLGSASGLLPSTWPRDQMVKKAESLFFTNYYVHKWFKYPEFEVTDFFGKSIKRMPAEGDIFVDVFLSSWCIPCQKITPKLSSIEAKYLDKKVIISYIFSHDKKKDAMGFLKRHFLKTKKVFLANHQTLKNFHNPPLPTVYIGGKDGFLLHRIEHVKISNLVSLDKFLENYTQF